MDIDSIEGLTEEDILNFYEDTIDSGSKTGCGCWCHIPRAGVNKRSDVLPGKACSSFANTDVWAASSQCDANCASWCGMPRTYCACTSSFGGVRQFRINEAVVCRR